MPLAKEYEAILSGLTGMDFQEEICTRLLQVILGFQTIPTKPFGDAGLDGLSHNGERGYCCYGQEPNEFKTNKQRENAVIDKFKGDLRWILELETQRKKLLHKENHELCTIIPTGAKLAHITLLTNWFESHRILGPIATAFAEYKAVSQKRYVDALATCNILGPREFSNVYGADESTLIRANQRVIAQRVQQSAKLLSIKDPKNFDYKMALLLEIRPDQADAVNALTDQLRSCWKMSLAFERELDDTTPTLFRSLETSRGRILRRVSELMLKSQEPWAEIGRAAEIAEDVLDKDFSHLYGALIQDVAFGETARLIGDCPITWNKSKGA